MHDKNMKITVGITFFLFFFIISLIYILYCYSYYDGAQQEKYLNEFNSNHYEFVYEHLADRSKLKKADYNKVIDLMYNKNTLENIYNIYYKDQKIFNNSAEFINEYYYGNQKIQLEDIEFEKEGKSTLFHRSKFYYKKINVHNEFNDSALGLINNVTFSIDNNSTLVIDGQRLTCPNNKCVVDYMFMGLHEINYLSNGFTYYGLVNVTSNVRDINISVLDNLVNVDFDLETGANVFNKTNVK